jgi:hypothetical protein
MTDGERGTKIPHQIFLDELLGSKNVRQELVSTLGDDGYGRFQIKTWLQKFGNGNISCRDDPHTQRSPLT